MPRHRSFFTSESVTEGHPDKLADRISDSVLDAILEKDPNARVACETSVSTGLVLLTGEISTKAHVPLASVVRNAIAEVGYTRSEYGLDAAGCAVLLSIDPQSPDISAGVGEAEEVRLGKSDDPRDRIGAGDQGMVFGYASNETPEFLPTPIALAHRLARTLAALRKDGTLPYLRPDGKSQVTVEYDGGEPVRVDTVLLAAQHDPDVATERIAADVKELVVREAIPPHLVDARTKVVVNGTGRFVVGGPHGDAGLTGRKIIVDTYGGFARHGGGAFSGKDPTKVDRSGAYAARWVAKNVVASGLARRCEVQIAYAIGVARPISVLLDTFGTGEVGDRELLAIVRRSFDLRPAAILEELDLLRPIYRQLSAYGHFGRTELDLPWERTDRVKSLKAAS